MYMRMKAPIPAGTAARIRRRDRRLRLLGDPKLRWDLARPVSYTHLGLDIPEDEDYDPVGGMVFSCLHTIPQDGETLEVEVNGLRIHVKRVEDRRVEEALVEKLPTPSQEEEEEKEE